MSTTSRSSSSYYMLLTSVTPYKGVPGENIVTIESHTFWTGLIYPREGTEPLGNKPHYEGSYFSNFEHSYGGNNTFKFTKT